MDAHKFHAPTPEKASARELLETMHVPELTYHSHELMEKMELARAYI
jgi:hypothetical protein